MGSQLVVNSQGEGALAQRHLDTRRGGAWVRTSNLPLTSQTSLPPELPLNLSGGVHALTVPRKDMKHD